MKNLPCVLLLMLLLLCACQTGKKDQVAQVSPAFEAERNAFFNNLKNPEEVAAQLQALVPEFKTALIHDPNRFTAYANNPVKAAANLGIYLSDLNYSVAYRQSTTTGEIFHAAYELSNLIGIEKSVLDFLMKRYQDNLAQNDSVEAVVHSLFAKSTTGLRGTTRERLVGIAMAAYQIENLHLALGLIDVISNNEATVDQRTQALTPLYEMVLSQKSKIEITYSFLTSVSDVTDVDKNPNYPFYSNAIRDLIGTYSRLPAQGTLTSVQVQESMKAGATRELSESVNAIRSKIISTE